jgi:hypothetical protein
VHHARSLLLRPAVLTERITAILRQNAIVVHAPQKRPPKDCSLGPSLCGVVSVP